MKYLRSVLVTTLFAALLLATGYALQQNGQAPEAAASPRGQSEGPGSTIFGNTCEQCHGKIESAPSPATLKKMTPEHIYFALTQGDMVQMAKELTDLQKRQIAEWVGGRMLGSQESGDASKMPNRCAVNPPIRNLTSTGSWNSWSPELNNTRFQDGKDANMTAAKVARLKVKWAFGFPGATETYAQPTIVDGRVFVSSDAGYVYSLDADTGCVHWSYDAGAGVRSAVVVGQLNAGSTRYAAFFGDIRGNVYAIDASTGKLIWKISIDPQPLSRITAGIVLYKHRLFVPVASLEEPESSSYNYLCCNFRGLVAALDAATGKQIWKTYTIPRVATKQMDEASLTRDRLAPGYGAHYRLTPSAMQFISERVMPSPVPMLVLQTRSWRSTLIRESCFGPSRMNWETFGTQVVLRVQRLRDLPPNPPSGVRQVLRRDLDPRCQPPTGAQTRKVLTLILRRGR
jgi:hypothetical protein